MPSILACLDPKIHKKGIYLLMSIGGFEEGVMAAVAAKAVGGVAEGKGWSADPEISKSYQKTWGINDLVPGRKADCLVSISAITADKWFNLLPFSTLTVDKSGVKIEKRVHH